MGTKRCCKKKASERGMKEAELVQQTLAYYILDAHETMSVQKYF